MCAPIDPERAGIVMDLLRCIALDQEAAILVVTRDESIFNRFDRVLRLRDGRLVSRPRLLSRPIAETGPLRGSAGVRPQ